jgi:hypothetical protein
VITLIVVARRVEGFALAPLAVALGRMLAAAATMALAVWLVARNVGTNAGAGAVIRVAAGTVTGVVVYLAALVALRTPEVAQLRRRLLRR